MASLFQDLRLNSYDLYPSNFFLFLNLIEIYIFRENETSLKLRQIFFNVLFIKLIDTISRLRDRRNRENLIFISQAPRNSKLKIHWTC